VGRVLWVNSSEKISLLCYHHERKVCREMPLKIRQLKAQLKNAGFSSRPGKGSHTVWEHPNLPHVRVTIAGKDGDDARRYLVEEVQHALDQLKGKQR
jgi:predicted RNA binding protein YcfA (HicA-like mRNA interferase family)